jgi:hypothetical protein
MRVRLKPVSHAGLFRQVFGGNAGSHVFPILYLLIMARNKNREQRIFDFRRKGMKPGFCHCCGIYVTELTDEHAPPLRTQKLIPDEMLVRNSMMKLSKRNLPPSIRGLGGFKFKTFCKVCQGKTEKLYGNAFCEWTKQGLALAGQVTEFDDMRIKSPVMIQPLNVIKQMASNALAVASYDYDPRKADLRKFVQNPAQKKKPHAFRFLLYLAPIRPNYELPQCRIEHDQKLLDVIRGITTELLAEIGVPPFGVAVLFQNNHRLPPHLQPLMDITHFADFELDQQATVDLDVPVRTVFGGVPLRFWQDAIKENFNGK